MPWIDDQPKAIIVDWLRRVNTPLVVSLPDGQILWANPAFEELLGYTCYELCSASKPVTWKSLTVDKADLEIDEMLVDDTVKGLRQGYYIQKRFAHKSGTSVSVVIEVLRYPSAGDFEVFLVACAPMNHGADAMLAQLQTVRELLVPIAEACSRSQGFTVADIKELAKSHPKIFWFVVLLFSTLLFGDRVLELIQAATQFNPGP